MELHNDSKNNLDNRKILAALMVYIRKLPNAHLSTDEHEFISREEAGGNDPPTVSHLHSRGFEMMCR
jgi:hypothetical protein